METRELENPAYVRNDSMRCFHCKDELFTVLEAIAKRHGFDAIAYGVNSDDQGDFRPGQQAAREHHVLAPLLEAELSKADIRQLARQAELASMGQAGVGVSFFAHGVWQSGDSRSSERGRARRRRAAGAGIPQFRVRHHGDIVRIEIAVEEMPRALTQEMAREFTAIFKGLGFKFVTLDLEGFRSGSMNQLLTTEELLRRS